MTILRDKYKLGPQATRAEELQHEVVAKAFADAETKRKQTLEGGGTEADVSKRLVKLQQLGRSLDTNHSVAAAGRAAPTRPLVRRRWRVGLSGECRAC